MKVIRAEAMGLCFGVRDALAAVDAISDPLSVTIHGELVYNQQVLVQLETRGFKLTPERSRASSLPLTPRVLVTAHGISDIERHRLLSAGKTLIDTTCPLVRRAHRAAMSLSNDGYHLLVIGNADHIEVRGIVEDLKSYDVIENVGDVRSYPHHQLGIVCQTTAPSLLVDGVRQAIRRNNPQANICFVDTICQPTIDRQWAVERLCRQVDVIVVVGGQSSNNTRRLAERARERGVTAYHVQSADELVSAWFESCRTVGLTAGTSTLDSTIEEVYQILCNMPKHISSQKGPHNEIASPAT
jgi:4-hydroxy-3-methylbut-2-enyl diphosphate reductase